MSTHCDLGSRYPLDRCPTRVNPEVSKQYESASMKIRSQCKSFNHAPKQHTYSFNQVAKNLGISKQYLHNISKEIYGGRATIDLSNDEVLGLISYIKSTVLVRRERKLLKEYAGELKIGKDTFILRCRKTFPDKPPKDLTPEEIDMVVAGIKSKPIRRKSLTKSKA